MLSGASGQSWILIGDVSGHGVATGLIMMMVQSAVRTAVFQPPGAPELLPASMLARVNASLWSNLQQIGGTST